MCLTAAAAFLSVSDSIIKWLSPIYALHEIMFFRALFAIIVVLGIVQQPNDCLGVTPALISNGDLILLKGLLPWRGQTDRANSLLNDLLCFRYWLTALTFHDLKKIVSNRPN